MIETTQSVLIEAPIAEVWDFAHDIGKWAELMPGLVDCNVLDEDHSRWTLKVGAGALVRTVKVEVHVTRWAGPAEVDFTYKLERDPVHGSGTYRAAVAAGGSTEMRLSVAVNGTGPMAPMWEAMGRPLLPKFACSFAEEFKAKIEAGRELSLPVCTDTAGKASLLARLWRWLTSVLKLQNPGDGK